MRGTPLALTVALAALCVSRAAAQTAPAPDPPPVGTPRADFSGSLGWLNVNKSGLNPYNDWYNRGVHGGAAFGWYWTPHLKTELEASVSTRVRFASSREEFVGGMRTHVFSEYGFRTRRLTLSQQYQFGENAWFHPHVAAGVDFNSERISQLDRRTYFTDVIVRPPPVGPPRTDVANETRTDLHIRPLVAAGFKAYMTPRAFVRSDVRLFVGERIEEALVRFGVGVDF